jgi:hypothetical protein
MCRLALLVPDSQGVDPALATNDAARRLDWCPHRLTQ